MFLERLCELSDSCVHLFVDAWKLNCKARKVQHKIVFVISVRG